MELFDKLPEYPEIERLPPKEIERRSFEIIRAGLTARKINLEDEKAPVIIRCIHTSADFSFAQNLYFSPDAVKTACKILKNEKPVIITDTNMAKAGISSATCKKFGIDVVCFMSDDDVATASKSSGLTRAACSVDKAVQSFSGSGRPLVFVSGNAPTFLVRLRQLYDGDLVNPAFLVAAPVGFVNVVAAKELLLKTKIPLIAVKGNKGGSNIAAAIVNSLLYID